MRKQWTDEDILVIKSILEKHQELQPALQAISEEFKRPVTRHAVDGAFKRRGMDPAFRHLAPISVTPDEHTDVLSIESSHKDPKPYSWLKGHRKVLLLPDAHIPFHDRDLVLRAIDEDGDAGACILAGDTVDCYQVGPHGSRSVRTTLEQDTETAIELVGFIAKHLKTTWIDGNHERWIFNHQSKRTKTSIKFLQQHSNLGNYISWRINSQAGRVNPQGRIVDPVVSYVQPPNNWLCRINNVIVSHPNNFFKTPALKTAVQTFNYHHARDKTIEGVFIGHTHRVGLTNHIFDDTNVYACEIGCLCHEMDYSIMGNINYKNPPQPGWGVIYFNDDGSLDRHNSGFRQ